MERNTLKTAITAFAVSFTAIIAAPAFAACDLCTLTKNGDLAGINTRLDNRPEVSNEADAQSVDINGQNNNGNTALLVAARYQQFEILERLLTDPVQSANPNIANNNGRTPLMWGAQRGNLPVVQTLVENGASISTIGGKQNKSALQYALDKGRTEVAEYLVANGATLDCGVDEEFNADTIACEIPEPDCPYFTIAHSGECISPPHNECIFTGGEWTDNAEFSAENWNGSFDGAGEFCDCGDGMHFTENGCVPLPDCGVNEIRADDGESCVCVDGHDRVANGSDCREIPICVENEVRNGDSCVCKPDYERYDGVCVAKCQDGYERNADTGMCEPTPKTQCEMDGGHYVNEQFGCFDGDTSDFHRLSSWDIISSTPSDRGYGMHPEAEGFVKAYMDSDGDMNHPIAAFWFAWTVAHEYSNEYYEIMIRWTQAPSVNVDDWRPNSRQDVNIVYAVAAPVNDIANNPSYKPLRYFVDNHPEVSVNGEAGSVFIPLHIAVAQQSMEAAQILIDAGADCNIGYIDYLGFYRTPFTLARDNGYTEILALLEDRCGPEVQAAYSQECETHQSATQQADGTVVVEEVEECEEVDNGRPPAPIPPFPSLPESLDSLR
ncbi:MAG: ankyrin repeat domain-containing protein [Gammaproteobacteria bacterium]